MSILPLQVHSCLTSQSSWRSDFCVRNFTQLLHFHARHNPFDTPCMRICNLHDTKMVPTF